MIGKLGTESKGHIRKYSCVNRTTQLRNKVPSDALETLSSKPSNFRERVRIVIN
jgi:DNA transposition AAA+ family ATPase